MRVSVLKNHFEGLPGAMADIAKDGFWPTTFISKPSPPPAVHWHECDVHGYVMEAMTWILDGETGELLTIEPGDKLVIPAGALHIEGEGEETVSTSSPYRCRDRSPTCSSSALATIPRGRIPDATSRDNTMM